MQLESHGSVSLFGHVRDDKVPSWKGKTVATRTAVSATLFIAGKRYARAVADFAMPFGTARETASGFKRRDKRVKGRLYKKK
jgi:hypothetical protein